MNAGGDMENEQKTAPTRAFWILSSLALVWNLLGVATYLMQVMTDPASLADLPDDERALLTDIPAWVTAAYAIGVFGGTLGSIALLLRKPWAVPVFAVSLIAIIAQMAHALFLTDMLTVLGTSSAIMPIVIVAVAALLLWYAGTANKHGWLAK